MHCRFPLLLTVFGLLLTEGCATTQSEAVKNGSIVAFFTPGTDPDIISARRAADFPQYYLELNEPWAQAAACEGLIGKDAEHAACLKRMQRLADYFNSGEAPPAEQDLGVALEGGGTKAAAFSMGVLAGLQQTGLLDSRVKAIASVSGGGYAASYLFNRYLDRLQAGDRAGSDADWFKSCIPQYFMTGEHWHLLSQLKDEIVDKGLGCGEIAVNGLKFSDNKYYGHILTEHDVLLSNMDESTITTYRGTAIAGLRLAELSGETLVAIPLQFLGRTLFRWPFNNAPSKFAYKSGLERAYGYSPDDWEPVKHDWFGVELCSRMTDRSLYALQQAHDQFHIPRWIIAATAPGYVGFDAWLRASPRDPVRQQFEITYQGAGSGIYGYTAEPLETPLDWYDTLFCPGVKSMPIVPPVTSAAAFFDDEQLLVSQQPWRLLFGIFQQFADITWFSEMPNYNTADSDRYIANALPYPFYMLGQQQQSMTPYIHLQDGGNSDNTGILPLLRRGYKHIVYAHATQDTTAQWSSICHLKNQLELDGKYRIDSPDFEQFMAGQNTDFEFMQTSGRDFGSYLDGICAAQLDDSDLVTYDENPFRNDQDNAVARLYCSRLSGTTQTDADGDCPEYTVFYSKIRNSEGTQLTENSSFYHWPAGQKMQFLVKTANRGINGRHDGPDGATLSSIIAIVPGVAFADFKKQVEPFTNQHPIHNWEQWCEEDQAFRLRQSIKFCASPERQILPAGRKAAVTAVLPCTALAHLLESACSTDAGSKHPSFPQDDFIAETIEVDYATYAAYFDLGRHQVGSGVCGGVGVCW